MDDVRFWRLVLWMNGAVPGALLAWDAYHGRLGADGTNYALHTTGTMGLVFLSLALAVTPVRKITGWNKVIFARRILGLYGFFYIAAHFLIFWLVHQAGSIAETAAEIWKRWYLTIGILGLTCMIPLAVTSTNGMIRRMGPKRWHLLHRLAYVATSLGVVHALLQGKVTTLKSKAFAVVVGGLLAFRLVAWVVGLARGRRPMEGAVGAVEGRRRYWTGELEVERVVSETPSVRTFRLRAAGGGELPFEHAPGQYLNLALEIDGKRVNRSYTIASAPTQRKYCELTIKREEGGVASCHMHGTVKAGDRLAIGAPAGRFTFTGAEAGSIVLIGGGVGITPLMSILRALTDRGWKGEIYLVYSVRSEDEVIFREELEGLKKQFANLHVHVTVSRGEGSSAGVRRGRITEEMLREVVPDVSRQLFYVCGPTAMMDAVTEVLRGLGVVGERVKREAFVSAKGSGGSAAGDVAPAEATTPPGPVEVTFSVSGKTVGVAAGQTILEAGEEAGLSLEFECRSGICGQCKKRLLSGQVAMEVEDALTASEKAQNVILLCQAMARGAVTVEA